MLPEGAVPIATPYLQMRDSKGSKYRSTMKSGAQEGEWVWNSGLDVAGRWSGTAFAPCRGQIYSARMPPIRVRE
jgi:hypothetical protein